MGLFWMRDLQIRHVSRQQLAGADAASAGFHDRSRVAAPLSSQPLARANGIAVLYRRQNEKLGLCLHNARSSVGFR